MGFKEGEKAPHDGEVECIQHPEIRANVKAGESFPNPGHFGENEACAWEYLATSS